MHRNILISLDLEREIGRIMLYSLTTDLLLSILTDAAYKTILFIKNARAAVSLYFASQKNQPNSKPSLFSMKNTKAPSPSHHRATVITMNPSTFYYTVQTMSATSNRSNNSFTIDLKDDSTSSETCTFHFHSPQLAPRK